MNLTRKDLIEAFNIAWPELTGKPELGANEHKEARAVMTVDDGQGGTVDVHWCFEIRSEGSDDNLIATISMQHFGESDGNRGMSEQKQIYACIAMDVGKGLYLIKQIGLVGTKITTDFGNFFPAICFFHEMFEQVSQGKMPDTTKIWEDASSRKLDHHLSENLLNHANDPIDDSFGFKEIDPPQKQKKR
ncbi:MAG: hypothetical protein U9N14_00515, partial [Pseudomonadota bacterium]|nr:hypothetical protein [Pseudomonadota bacterium]